MNAKRWIPTLLLTLFILGSFWAYRLYRPEQFAGHWAPGQVDDLNRLSMRLNSKYKRAMEVNGYSIYYEPIHPNQIIVKARYTSEIDAGRIEAIVESAIANVEKVAKENGMEIQVRRKIEQVR